MQILIFNWRDPKNPLSGGAEIVTMAHAKAWISAGHRVTWFTSRFPGGSKHEKINGVDIVRYGTSHTVYIAAPFYYFFSKQSFDVVIDEIHGLPFFTPLYVRKPKIAFIHEVAEEIWDYMSSFPFNKLGRLVESLYFYVYHNVLFWTDASSTVDDLVRHGIPRSLCIAIPCPADSKPLAIVPRKEPELTLIFVSRLVKMKGVEDVIRAFGELSIRAHLWIVGSGDPLYITYLQQVVRRLGNKGKHVVFYGKVTEAKKVRLLRRAHILLHASIKEGWGLVVMEAASQGTPSIVYNVGGLRDSVKNGITGVVLPTNTPWQMAKEIASLMSDKERYARYQKNCLAWAKSLTWNRVTKQSLNLLDRATQKT